MAISGTADHAELQIFKPELHAFVYRAVFEVADQVIGAKAVDELLSSYGLARAAFDDSEAWVSLEFTESFLDALYKRANDPQIYNRVGRLALSPKYLGPRYAFLRAFQTPISMYKLIARAGGTMNRTGTYTVENSSDSSCVITFKPVPSIGPEKTPHMCRLRYMMIATTPTLFDLPPAHIEHTTCVARGNPVCIYTLSWETARGKTIPWIVSGLGGAASLVYFGLAGGASWSWITAAAVSACCGWALGKTYQLQRELFTRTGDLTAQQDALEASLQANEHRFAELLQAKAEVDQQVEQRTKELSSATKRLSEMLREIQDLDRAKTEFFNNVSHELRSPLTLILAPLEDLTAGRTPPGGERTALESMRRNAARLLHLINQLLDLAKIDAGQMEIFPVPTDLVALVKSTLTGFEAAARSKGVRVDLSVPASLPPLLLDVSWIESAVTNLIANALRFTNSGGAVRISIADQGGDVCVSVSDDGPGIAAEDHGKVFARFAQGDSSKRVVGGTGIGLALVREAARLHGGDVRLVSELGKGSTFALTLPRRPDVPVDARPSERPVSRESGARLLLDEQREPRDTDRPGPHETAPLALVVEDNAELREFVADVLSVRYRVRTASDGAQAIRLASALRPDVVVSDVAMPEMDGYQLCRALRADANTQNIPVLLVTARTEVASVLEGFDAGANDYVLKPFHGRELLARVDVHVQLRRMVQEFALRERHATLGVLAASVAHQVRNPLTTLVSGLPAMRNRIANNVDQRTRDLIDVMIDCAGRIERMTVDLMDLSRIDREAGGDYRPSDGLQAAVRMLRARLPGTNVSVQDRIDESSIVHGRPGDMNHVFLNLLDNAARAVQSSGTIRVEGWTEGGQYVVRVGDTGPGIDDATAQRIFEPFFTTRAAGEGTGLGLAIARQVVHQAGGRIEVGRSELGGAAFTVSIPITKHPSIRAPLAN